MLQNVLTTKILHLFIEASFFACCIMCTYDEIELISIHTCMIFHSLHKFMSTQVHMRFIAISIYGRRWFRILIHIDSLIFINLQGLISMVYIKWHCWEVDLSTRLSVILVHLNDCLSFNQLVYSLVGRIFVPQYMFTYNYSRQGNHI